MCTEYLQHIHSLPPFPHILTLSLVPTPPPNRTYLAFLSSVYVKRKLAFCLFKIAMQEVSMWHFHVYMYYNPNCFIPSVFLLSTLIPFLWISAGLKILYSFFYRKYINHTHLHNFLFLPSLSHMWPPLSVSCFS
jgi:hypothetical protein